MSQLCRKSDDDTYGTRRMMGKPADVGPIRGKDNLPARTKKTDPSCVACCTANSVSYSKRADLESLPVLILYCLAISVLMQKCRQFSEAALVLLGSSIRSNLEEINRYTVLFTFSTHFSSSTLHKRRCILGGDCIRISYSS